MSLPEDVVARELRRARGSIPDAAAALGVPEDVLFDLVSASPALQAVLQAELRDVARAAYDVVQANLRRGQFQAAAYLLDRLGHVLGVGPPTVTVTPVADSLDVLTRIDAVEQQLAGKRVPLRDALTIIELRRSAVSDVQRSGQVASLLQAIAAEVVRALETHVRDPHARHAILQELAGVLPGTDQGTG